MICRTPMRHDQLSRLTRCPHLRSGFVLYNIAVVYIGVYRMEPVSDGFLLHDVW